MTEPSRALVEAAKLYLDTSSPDWAKACQVAYDELAAESASPPTSGSSTTPAEGGAK